MFRLRGALRAAASAPNEEVREFAARAVDRAAEPLVERIYAPLSRYCRRLIAGAPLLRDRMEADDLTQDTWLKALRYLREPTGDKIVSDRHFNNLLYRIALTLFQDNLDQYSRASDILVNVTELDAAGAPRRGMAGSEARGETRGDQIEASDTWRADRGLLLGDDSHVEMLARLFRDETGFRAASRFPIHRSLARYRAFVLLQLGLYMTEEMVRDDATADAAELRLLRAFVAHLGLPPDWWAAVESAAMMVALDAASGATLDALLPIVNRICGMDLKTGNSLSVLRYELNASVGG